VFSIFPLNEFFDRKLCLLGQIIYTDTERARTRLMGFPTRPPCRMPGVQPAENRLWLFDGQFPNGAICATMDFFDE
jgi:hypothetical protein